MGPAAAEQALTPATQVLFKPIRREGEYLDVFLKVAPASLGANSPDVQCLSLSAQVRLQDVLRGCGQEDAWLRASADPWATLDCTPRTRFMFQARAAGDASQAAVSVSATSASCFPHYSSLW